MTRKVSITFEKSAGARSRHSTTISCFQNGRISNNKIKFNDEEQKKNNEISSQLEAKVANLAE